MLFQPWTIKDDLSSDNQPELTWTHLDDLCEISLSFTQIILSERKHQNVALLMEKFCVIIVVLVSE